MNSTTDELFKLKAYSYTLPESLIAQSPLEQRDKARLLVVNRRESTLTHDTFDQLKKYIPSQTHFVLNNTKVIPARLLGTRLSGGNIEVFILNILDDESKAEVLLKPLKKIREGELIHFSSGITGVLINKEKRIFQFNKKNILSYLQDIGHIPLPPYIKRKDTPSDNNDYQTVYAKELGSVAAPTAGLHFTQAGINELKELGHHFSEVTLHINYGTFKPVESDDIRHHPMHSEYYNVNNDTYENIINTKRPIIAVGTTSCRVLESMAQTQSKSGLTSIFIYPGYEFQTISGLITNFHLPSSTLLMLVCAFGGYDLIMKAYQEAISKNYRFYSYGDAMLII